MKMKHALCSLVLLIMMSATGLLIGSKSASAQDVARSSDAPIVFADLGLELDGSTWRGSWTGGNYFNFGSAKLFLVMLRDNKVNARFSIYGTGEGDSTFWMKGTLSGNVMKLTTAEATVTLTLSGEKSDKLMLRGGYDLTGGFYAGYYGTYYFKKTK